MLPYNKSFVKNAQVLRKNMTPEEKHLWYDFLKRLPFPVKRQHNIENYIVDFYIPKEKIIIEIDGKQHDLEKNKKSDVERDAIMASHGITVLRYTNTAINKNFHSVANDILKNINLTIDDLM